MQVRFHFCPHPQNESHFVVSEAIFESEVLFGLEAIFGLEASFGSETIFVLKVFFKSETVFKSEGFEDDKQRQKKSFSNQFGFIV